MSRVGTHLDVEWDDDELVCQDCGLRTDGYEEMEDTSCSM